MAKVAVIKCEIGSVPSVAANALHPGSKTPVDLVAVFVGTWKMTVPLVRGMAMVKVVLKK